MKIYFRGICISAGDEPIAVAFNDEDRAKIAAMPPRTVYISAPAGIVKPELERFADKAVAAFGKVKGAPGA